MKLLRKKIQKRSDKDKERKLLKTQAEDKETGMSCRTNMFLLHLFSVSEGVSNLHARLATLASHERDFNQELLSHRLNCFMTLAGFNL